MHNSISITNLAVGYTEYLLKDINLELENPCILPIIGANGSGKTTFLKTISGFTSSLSGEIKYGNQSLQELNISERASLFAISFDEIRPPFEITVHELLEQSSNTLDPELIKNLELNNFLDKVYQKLSSGQKQRINIARALLQNTPFVFLDEPTSALDPPHKMEVMLFLKEFCTKHNKIILMSVHDVQIALELFDRFLIVKGNNLNEVSRSYLIESEELNHTFPSEKIVFDSLKQRFTLKDN